MPSWSSIIVLNLLFLTLVMCSRNGNAAHNSYNAADERKFSANMGKTTLNRVSHGMGRRAAGALTADDVRRAAGALTVEDVRRLLGSVRPNGALYEADVNVDVGDAALATSVDESSLDSAPGLQDWIQTWQRSSSAHLRR